MNVGRNRATRRLLVGTAVAAGFAAATTASAQAATTATFNAGVLTVTGDNADNNIAISRNAAGAILVNGGAIAVVGGAPTVANTTLIQSLRPGRQRHRHDLRDQRRAAPRQPVRRLRQRRPHRRLGR